MGNLDSFENCRRAFEKSSWSYDEAVGELDFDFSKRFLPLSLCGRELPAWMSDSQRRLLNQIRGYSYAHVFFVVEEFIIEQTCATAMKYVHVNNEAVSATLKFADEETKHQRMFSAMKARLLEGFGFEPGAISNKEELARAICSHSDFAVYLLCLVVEWMTQRHYIECFKEEENELDPTFVKVFRLHWAEEAQHARLDAMLLKDMVAGMGAEEIQDSVNEFSALLEMVAGLLGEQDKLDIQSFESADGPLEPEQREALLEQLHKDWRWTFISSGLEHKAFKSVYLSAIPDGSTSLEHLATQMADHTKFVGPQAPLPTT